SQDVDGEDAGAARPKHAGRRDVILPGKRRRHGAGDPGEGWKREKADGEDQVGRSGTKGGGGAESEQKSGKRKEHIDHPRDEGIDPSTPVTRRQADPDTGGKTQSDSKDRHQDRDPGPVKRAAEKIPAEFVGAK